jgi:translocation and assembly module TamA
VALGAEARFRFLEDYGAVAFVEGGRTFDSGVPTFDEPLFWSAGNGARYYTDFGPIRLDVATPLNGRSGIDDSFQIYVSFGQAF